MLFLPSKFVTKLPLFNAWFNNSYKVFITHVLRKFRHILCFALHLTDIRTKDNSIWIYTYSYTYLALIIICVSDHIIALFRTINHRISEAFQAYIFQQEVTLTKNNFSRLVNIRMKYNIRLAVGVMMQLPHPIQLTADSVEPSRFMILTKYNINFKNIPYA